MTVNKKDPRLPQHWHPTGTVNTKIGSQLSPLLVLRSLQQSSHDKYSHMELDMRLSLLEQVE